LFFNLAVDNKYDFLTLRHSKPKRKLHFNAAFYYYAKLCHAKNSAPVSLLKNSVFLWQEILYTFFVNIFHSRILLADQKISGRKSTANRKYFFVCENDAVL